MLRSLALFILIGLTYFSCKKDNTVNPIDPELAGQWKMISSKDNSSSTVTTKPPGLYIDIDIVIAFTTSTKGKISGGVTQASVKGDFTIDQQKMISIPAIYMLYPGFCLFIGSTQWDDEFLNNITISKEYFFDSNGNLNINTSNNKILTFTRQ
jgi:hypothetical protein